MKKRNVQIYGINPIDDDFTIGGNPYNDLGLVHMLEEQGILFYRDDENTKGAVWRKSSEVIDGYFSWFLYDFGADKIIKFIQKNKEVRIKWMDEERVNREFL